MWQAANQRLVIDNISEMLNATDKTYADQLTQLFDEAGRIFISGAGRSRLVGNFLGMRLMHSGYNVAIVGEIVTPSVKPGDLLEGVHGSRGSGSGRAVYDDPRVAVEPLVLS